MPRQVHRPVSPPWLAAAAVLQRFDNAWRDRDRDPLDTAAVCDGCRFRYAFEGRPPGPCALRWPLLLTAALVPTALGVWLKHRDAGAVMAALLCAVCVVLLWKDWSTPCAQCRALQNAPKDSPVPPPRQP